MYVLESSLRSDLRGGVINPHPEKPAKGPDDIKGIEESLASQADSLCPEGSDYYDHHVTKELFSHMTGLHAHSSVELYEDEATQLKQLSLAHQDMFAASNTDLCCYGVVKHEVRMGATNVMGRMSWHPWLRFQSEEDRYSQEMLDLHMVSKRPGRVI